MMVFRGKNGKKEAEVVARFEPVSFECHKRRKRINFLTATYSALGPLHLFVLDMHNTHSPGPLTTLHVTRIPLCCTSSDVSPILSSLFIWTPGPKRNEIKLNKVFYFLSFHVVFVLNLFTDYSILSYLILSLQGK